MEISVQDDFEKTDFLKTKQILKCSKNTASKNLNGSKFEHYIDLYLQIDFYI